MSFPAYPQYKDSGIETLGVIPDHWDVTRLPYVVFDNNAGEVIDKNFWGDGSELLYTCAKQPLLSDYKDFPFRKRTGENDLLLTRNGTPYVHLPVQGSIYSNVVQRVSLIPSMDRNFMRAALDVATRDLVGYGVSIASFNYEMWTALRIPLPVCEEQTQIARFLDHETARIDALIKEQQRLIELLKEKRQAVISHAVTKGLDPTAPMKDSGVEWLGEVPAHWVVSKFGYISSVVRGGSPRPAGDPELFNGDFSPWVTVAEITKDDEIHLEETETFLTKKGSDQCRIFSKGTLLLSNSGATLGVPKILMINANANDGVVGFENISLDKEYSYFYLATLTEGLRERAAGSGQPNLNTDIVKSIDVPIPPSNEVAEIVVAVRKLRAQFHLLSKEAAEGIGLLQERRSALISAAVTGKIDVRSWKPPVCEQAPESVQEAM